MATFAAPVGDRFSAVAGRWHYLYRAIDQHGQVIDVFVSTRRNAAIARAFSIRARCHGPAPTQIATDKAPVYPKLIDELCRSPGT